LEETYTIVNDYTNSDIKATETEAGRILTDAINKLVQKWYGFLIPTSLIQNLLNALLFVVCGETFHKKLGLPQPSAFSTYIIYALAAIRRDFMRFMPPRTTPHRLSKILMKQNYMCPVTKANFLQVGPSKVLPSIVKNE
jgi:hypothetical protein